VTRGGQQLTANLTVSNDTFNDATAGNFTVRVFYMVAP